MCCVFVLCVCLSVCLLVCLFVYAVCVLCCVCVLCASVCVYVSVSVSSFFHPSLADIRHATSYRITPGERAVTNVANEASSELHAHLQTNSS